MIGALYHCEKLKGKRSGQVARMSTVRWPNIVTHWAGPNGKRMQGRPSGRGLDIIKKTAGNDWAVDICIFVRHFNTPGTLVDETVAPFLVMFCISTEHSCKFDNYYIVG
ncbi:hypothetical protein EVAR_15850_1 [Eumeta japonica]|uniref:Uncharacterized protein n=1 Tax=Eumeta variegata TaxID=151549 RepID=A0A4C1UFE8_EUMVA|nr:hypothetical protein EVAR_15850_1 [Eumeta japonica]